MSGIKLGSPPGINDSTSLAGSLLYCDMRVWGILSFYIIQLHVDIWPLELFSSHLGDPVSRWPLIRPISFESFSQTTKVRARWLHKPSSPPFSLPLSCPCQWSSLEHCWKPPLLWGIERGLELLKKLSSEIAAVFM